MKPFSMSITSVPYQSALRLFRTVIILAGVLLWYACETVQSAQARGITARAARSRVCGDFKVGDAVEAWNIAWYKGRIAEVGAGQNQGQYLVDFDDYSTNQWVAAKNVRAISAPKVYAGPPRAGKYLVMGYGNPSNPLHLGYFVLRGGKAYRFYTLGDKPIGSGAYSFDEATKTVSWLSGPFKKNNWGGKFEITREGKTHTIRLNRATIGTNSSD